MVDSQSAFKLLFSDLPTYPQLAQFPSVTPGSTENSGGGSIFRGMLRLYGPIHHNDATINDAGAGHAIT